MKKLVAALVGLGLVAGSVAAASPASAMVPYVDGTATEVPVPAAPTDWATAPTVCGLEDAVFGDLAPTDGYHWSVDRNAFQSTGASSFYTLTAEANPGYVLVDNLGLTHSSEAVATQTIVDPYPDCDQPGTNLPNRTALFQGSSPTVKYGLRLNWQLAVENGTPVTGYQITAKVQPNGNNFKTFTASWTAKADASELLIKSVKARAKYTFTIIATSALGNSRPRSVMVYTDYDPRIKSNAPSKVNVAVVGKRSAFIKWDWPAANGAYPGPWDWQIKVFAGKKLVKTHVTDDMSWDASGLKRHTRYTYEVRGRDGSMSTKWSAKHSFKTK